MSAAVGSALAPYIDEHKVLALYPIVSDDDLTQRKISPYIVRTGWTSSQATQPLGDYAYKVLHYRKVATIGYDFAFGWQSIGGFMQTFQQDGGSVVRETWTPQTTNDFSPYLSQIPRDVDAVMCSFSGSTAINFFRQYKAFGLKMPLVCQGNATDESTLPQTGPSALGTVTALHYTAALDTPANTAFVAAYQKAYGHGPSYYAEGTYVGAMFLDRALAAAHGDTSDPLALAKALRNIVLTDAPRGPVVLDATAIRSRTSTSARSSSRGRRSRTWSSARTRRCLSSGRTRQRNFWPTRFTRARFRRATGAGVTSIGTRLLRTSGVIAHGRRAVRERPECRPPARVEGDP